MPDGTHFDTFPTGVAECGIHIARLSADLYREVPDVSGDFLDFAERQKLNVGMPTGIDGLGPEDSY
jgi:hypothetical protein